MNRHLNLQGSVTGKVLFIGALVLVLLIPLGMIKGVIGERALLNAMARNEVGRAWGQAQTVGGPILIVPFQFTRMSYGQAVTVSDELYVLPAELDFRGDVRVRELARGIYKIPVYTAQLTISGRFDPPALGTADYQDLEILWDQAQLALPLTDARSVKEPVRVHIGTGSAQFQPGAERVAGFGSQLVARYAELGLGAPDAPQAFSLELTLGGTGSLNFLPLGDVTRASLAANWASPHFGGAFLPDERSVRADGFTASWRVLDLGRGFASKWHRSDPAPAYLAAFGADLITPIGIHEATLRAAKYGVLIVGLSFAAYFLFELFAALRLHPLQYLLIGLANCVFYLLLLALAEQLGFGIAYVGSAVASSTLIAAYSAAVLQSLRRALPIAALLSAVYGYLYVVLRAEDYALLFGAVGLFAVLAAFMYLTRHIDWYSVTFGPRGRDAPRDDPAPHAHLNA